MHRTVVQGFRLRDDFHPPNCSLYYGELSFPYHKCQDLKFMLQYGDRILGINGETRCIEKLGLPIISKMFHGLYSWRPSPFPGKASQPSTISKGGGYVTSSPETHNGLHTGMPAGNDRTRQPILSFHNCNFIWNFGSFTSLPPKYSPHLLTGLFACRKSCSRPVSLLVACRY